MRSVLQPTSKLLYFEKNWPQELRKDVLECAETVVRLIIYHNSLFAKVVDNNVSQFRERWETMSTSPPVFQEGSSKLSKAGALVWLIREVQDSDSEDETVDNSPSASATADIAKPWRADFMRYIDAVEAPLPKGMTTIQWWGYVHMYLGDDWPDTDLWYVTSSTPLAIIPLGSRWHKTIYQ